jgi:hypothetical protein
MLGALMGHAPCIDAAPLTVTYVDSVTGWEWAEAGEITDLSWNDIAAVCPQDGSTACIGTLAGMEVSDWIWATRDQVRDLFANATDLTDAQLADYLENADSTWASQFLSLFDATGAGPVPGLLWAWGWSATTDERFAYNAFSPVMYSYTFPPGYPDQANLLLNPLKSFSDAGLGVWLYRPAAVPEPAMLTVFGSGLLFLSARHLRRRRQ